MAKSPGSFKGKRFPILLPSASGRWLLGTKYDEASDHELDYHVCETSYLPGTVF